MATCALQKFRQVDRSWLKQDMRSDVSAPPVQHFSLGRQGGLERLARACLDQSVKNVKKFALSMLA